MTRYDAFGMFWQDKERVKTSRSSADYTPRTLPPIPDTGWVAPKDFPNLAAAKAISLDLETCDPKLKVSGPGDLRGDGYVAGVAIGVPDGGRWYFPVRHENGAEDNLPADNVWAWLRDTLSNPAQPKLGANLMYDVNWLATVDVPVAGLLLDVQFAEALINENALKYDLDTLSNKYLGEGKVDERLYQWLALAYGGNPTRGDQGGRIHRAPPALVGPYAEGDVDLPLRIWQKQRPILEAEGLMDLFKLECKLVPLLMAMRKQGVRVNIDGAEEAKQSMLALTQDWQGKLNAVAGFNVDVWSGDSVARAYTKLGVRFPKTPKGAPSFRKEWLSAQSDPLSELVAGVRRYSKACSTFVDGYVVGQNIAGRLHSSIHPLKRVSDSGSVNGTVSGRFSYSDPNLQNIPARDKELATIIRGLFVPDAPGWRRYDYSQIEYRYLAHYAIGEGAEKIRAAYWDDPDTDYHETVRMLILHVTGIELERKPTKSINFGLAYGMGKRKLTRTLGLTDAQGEELFAAYHEGVPFVKKTYDRVGEIAQGKGYIKTILGRRSRFDMWAPKDYDLRELVKASANKAYVLEQVNARIAQAREVGERAPKGGAERGFTHKALNRLLQGGAADMMKKAMLDLYESGVFDVVGVPLITVHDELDFNDPLTKESEEAFKEVKHIMETSIKLKVPVIADCEKGTTWGNCK